MGFLDDFSTHIDVCFDQLGDPIIYTPSGGEAVTINAVIDFNSESHDVFGSGVQSPTLHVEIRVSDVASPAEGDSVSYKGVNYIVSGIPDLNSDRASWRLFLQEASS